MLLNKELIRAIMVLDREIHFLLQNAINSTLSSFLSLRLPVTPICT